MVENYANLPLQFRIRLETARRAVTEARAGNDKVRLANALKQLGSVERRQKRGWKGLEQKNEVSLGRLHELSYLGRLTFMILLPETSHPAIEYRRVAQSN